MSEQQSRTRTGSGPSSWDPYQVQDSLQSQGPVMATVLDYVPGTKGVWVLEKPRDELFGLLGSLPMGTQEQNAVRLNACMREAGAVFYADKDDYKRTREIMSRRTTSSHPSGGTAGSGEREAERGQGSEGLMIDDEETRSDDGSIHMLCKETETMEGGS